MLGNAGSRLLSALILALTVSWSGWVRAGDGLDFSALSVPMAWETKVDADAWSATPPMEDGNVFVEVRRFADTAPGTDIGARLASIKDVVRDFDPQAQFDDNPPARSARLADLAGRQSDVTYVLNGVQRHAWIVVIADPAGGEHLVWRYVAAARVFDDYLGDAVGVLEGLDGAIAAGAVPATGTQGRTTRAGEPAGRDKAQSPSGGADLEFWNAVKDKTDPRYFRAYLDSFPEGAFAPLARLRIEELGQAADMPPAASAEPQRPGAMGRTARAPVDQCDLEAADMHDPGAVVQTSNTDEFGLPQNPPSAYTACVKALAAWPDEPRFKLYLVSALDALKMGGDVLSKAGQYDDLALIREAAAADYAHGIFLLGVAALDGRYIEPGSDTQQTAVDLFRRAAAAGHGQARLRLALMLEGSIGSYGHTDYDEAARLLLAGLRDQNEGSYDALFTYPESRAKQTIMALQFILQRENLYSGRIDGDFGPKTQAATRAWMTR